MSTLVGIALWLGAVWLISLMCGHNDLDGVHAPRRRNYGIDHRPRDPGLRQGRGAK